MSNPKHQPTAEQRKTVKAMIGYGITQADIATVIGIDPKTLRLHYPEEIARGAVEANAQVAQSLFQAATKGKNMTAAIWWSKTRMAWKETIRVGGEPGGAPVVMQIISGVDRGEGDE
jgi:DNA-binding XRE family transcriptional regulator